MSGQAAPGAAGERDRLLAALAANTVVLPGLGSVLLGRRTGWVQATLALSGLAFTFTFLVVLVATWIQQGPLAVLPPPRLELAALGMGLFASGWGWALATSLREASRRGYPPAETLRKAVRGRRGAG